jgi:hypothetical protein
MADPDRWKAFLGDGRLRNLPPNPPGLTSGALQIGQAIIAAGA